MFALGWLFFVLGIIGLLLPVVPTTPFMLLALWAFSKSSARFHHWLYHHRMFGPRLRAFDEHRLIPLWVKLFAWGAMLTSASYVTLIATLEWYFVVPMVLVLGVSALYVARCPSRLQNGD